MLIASFLATSASEFWAAVCFSMLTLMPILPSDSAISCDDFSRLMSLFGIENVTLKPFGYADFDRKPFACSRLNEYGQVDGSAPATRCPNGVFAGTARP